MGILPLQFKEEESVETLGLTGHETFDILDLQEGVASGFADGHNVRVRAHREHGVPVEFSATVRIDTPQELLYYRHGGILQYVLRQLLAGHTTPQVVSKGLSTVGDPSTGSIPT